MTKRKQQVANVDYWTSEEGFQGPVAVKDLYPKGLPFQYHWELWQTVGVTVGCVICGMGIQSTEPYIKDQNGLTAHCGCLTAKNIAKVYIDLVHKFLMNNVQLSTLHHEFPILVERTKWGRSLYIRSLNVMSDLESLRKSLRLMNEVIPFDQRYRREVTMRTLKVIINELTLYRSPITD